MMKTTLVLAATLTATLAIGCGDGRIGPAASGSANDDGTGGGGSSSTHAGGHSTSSAGGSHASGGGAGDAGGGASSGGGGSAPSLPPSGPAPINIHDYAAGQGMAYCEWLPSNYADNDDLYPVVFTLHGVGEAGQCDANGCTSDSDQALLDKMTANGALKLIKDDPDGHYFLSHPALVFAPQHPSGWYNADTTAAFQSYILSHYRVDTTRIYVTGLSAGGGAVWDWANDQPTFFAAIIPIAGASNPPNGMAASGENNLAVWAFHDFDDPTVAHSATCQWTDAISALESGAAGVDPCASYPGQGGVDNAAADTETALFDANAPAKWTWQTGVVTSGNQLMRFTMYPSGGHDAWTKTYEDNDVWDWLFSHHR
jgi:predicted peptidase